MGMYVSAVAGLGIIVSSKDVEDLDGFYDLPEGLISHQVGAYTEENGEGSFYFLGAGAEVDWNEGVSGEPVTLLDAEAVRDLITLYLAEQGLIRVYSSARFGFHVYPLVN